MTLTFPQLTELYARQAREFAEAVALLGRYRQVGPEVVALMKEIKRRQSLCFETAVTFERFVQENRPMSDAQNAE